MKGLTNAQKADILRYAYDSISIAQYGQYHYRVALFDAFKGTEVSPDKLADFLLPPRDDTTSNWVVAGLLPDWVRASADAELQVVRLQLYISGM